MHCGIGEGVPETGACKLIGTHKDYDKIDVEKV
jgi:hypothetical protein